MKIGNFDSLLEDHLEDAKIIAIPHHQEEEDLEEGREELPLPEILPILPLKNTVLFPGVIMPISVKREASLELINDAKKDRLIGVVSQRNDNDTPSREDFYDIGVVARIIKILKIPDGSISVLVQGTHRFQITEFVEEQPYFKAKVTEAPELLPDEQDEEFTATMEVVRDISLKLAKETNTGGFEVPFVLQNIENDFFLVNYVASTSPLAVNEKQDILEQDSLITRAWAIIKYFGVELQKATLRKEIQNKVHMDFDKQQRDYFLHQQIQTIQKELGNESFEADIEKFKEQAKGKKWNEKIQKHFDKELAKLQRLNPQMPDYAIQRNYIDLLLELPWEIYSKDKFDLKRAQKILDKDHYGLEDVKRRIIEYLAVLKLRNDMKSPILCLYGPPGVGKTSLGRSIAKALGREYVRMALGGLRDEAEIRGHRKTYIGAMPGRILQLIKKAGTSNPVFVLDELDKLSQGYGGDPSSAMLEVLDPEQNNEFYDNFLEIGYDLSKVMFIATANDLSTIQPALKDRMEIINISGYTIEEKVEIARHFLLPKVLKEHGMEDKQIQLGKKEIERIIEGYTRESGVRNLEKQIAKIVRYIARAIAMEEEYNPKISLDDIRKILGIPTERDKYENNEVAGVVTGLAWTSVGGDILFIESAFSKGSGGLSITGNIGTVMKESATIALEYIKAHAEQFGLDTRIFEQYKIHIHIPEGATPKDGPSAGIALLTSLFSLLTQRRVKKNLAMTGEITLRGKVLPVGGIKEKILAAKRAGIKEIILCKDNEKDIDEIKQEYLQGLTFHYVTEMEEVLKLAVTQEVVKNPKPFTFEEKATGTNGH
ncbi:endopeptidase La [Capnocytophaga sp. oral taxon 863 str. F0517]|uniref:endopeptidase La n=1 Tax=Capnocytophaga sp. oral taxon 863 TaxID=1227265 RepID=UPI000396390C|nr:endopeptidase La [Capnocytophaga sp. oral taxon 863]ERI63153.1 endopeptidase La [Capnocytophaga sp. oral taxon 863 str. F0517]